MSQNTLHPSTPIRMHFEILPTPPFAFDLALAYLRGSPSTVVEQVDQSSYARAIRLDGRPALLRVRARATGDRYQPALAVELTGEALEQQDRDTAERLVHLIFSTNADISPLYDGCDILDPVFTALARHYLGLRPIVIPDLFEAIVWAILGQQINVVFAAKTKRALVERFGSSLEVDGSRYLLFPGPADLARAPEAELAAIQLSRQKIRYTKDLAQAIVEGRFDLEALRTLPAEEAQARLESLTGVGRWTAEYVLLRGLGHKDAIPAADGGLRRIIGRVYGLGRLATEAEVRAMAERWTGWRGYAAFYWWFTLQQEEQRKRAGKP